MRSFVLVSCVAFLVACSGSPDDAGGDGGSGSGGKRGNASAGVGGLGGTTSAGGSGTQAGSSNGGSGTTGGAPSGGSGGSGGTSGSGGKPTVVISPCDSLPEDGQWENVSPPDSGYADTYTGINVVVVRPDDPAIVYAAADEHGIFKSTDCGATWAQASTGENANEMKTGRAWSMVIDPIVPDTMYAVNGYGTSGLWKSTNAGVDWKQVLTSNVTEAFSAHGQITSVALEPADHTHVVVESHGTGNGVCDGKTCLGESTDAGETWALKTIDTGWAENSGVYLVDQQTWLYCALFSGLWRTSDQGTTWNQLEINGVLPSCNYYEPYLWQDSDGSYYLPGLGGYGASLLKSAPNDTSTFTPVPETPDSLTLMATGTKLFMSNEFKPDYYTADQSTPGTWSAFTAPPQEKLSSQGGGGVFMTYDPVHRVLYSANFDAGLWRIVTD